MRNEVAAIGVLSLLAAAATGASDVVDRLAWRQELHDAPPAGALFRVVVPAEVFDGSTSFPNDLRIVGSDGRPWPFFPWTDPDRSALASLEARILNRGTAEEDGRPRVVELGLSPGRHNRLRIDTEGRDYLRRVQVLGSTDRDRWLELADGWLIDYTEPARVHNDEIRYPESDLSFLKLKIWPNARDARESPVVTGVEVGRLALQTGDWETVALSRLPGEEANGETGAQTLVFDTGATNRPLERLGLEVNDEEFARPIRVSGRDAPDQDWQTARTGEIHRLGRGARLDVELSGFAHRFVRVEIFHYDDEPLDVAGVTGHALARYVVAESRADAPAYLYYGAAEPVDPPRFDLEERTDDRVTRAAITVTLGAREANDRFRFGAARRALPWITGAAIAVVSLILVWVIAGMLRRGNAVSP